MYSQDPSEPTRRCICPVFFSSCTTARCISVKRHLTPIHDDPSLAISRDRNTTTLTTHRERLPRSNPHSYRRLTCLKFEYNPYLTFDGPPPPGCCHGICLADFPTRYRESRQQTRALHHAPHAGDRLVEASARTRELATVLVTRARNVTDPPFTSITNLWMPQ